MNQNEMDITNDAAAEMERQRDARELITRNFGTAWNTQELQRDYEVKGFCAPFVTVTRKADGKEGSMRFTHYPRYYFDFIPDGL